MVALHMGYKGEMTEVVWISSGPRDAKSALDHLSQGLFFSRGNQPFSCRIPVTSSETDFLNELVSHTYHPL